MPENNVKTQDLKEEVPNKKCPWRLTPVEGVKCSECKKTKCSDKTSCNYAACPYSNDGEW